MAFYLKYRPQSLDELVGQESVKITLHASFLNNKLSHAYLFVGPRGTGKTSTARILAKMVNCEKSSESLKADIYPCNKCSTCISITDGSNMDLIEIDAASNRGIEDIRSLRDKIKLSPTNSNKKIYIIDEVHMLTTEAFNALLKTLEEPPQHALFILATTEGAKMPQTILSRVQRLDFKLATCDQLLEALKRIVTAEKIDIEEEALKLLVNKADGSFRDGVKLLDQIASIGEKITAELLQKSLKSSNFDDILDLVNSFSQKNINASLSLILKQVEIGADIKELTLSLMDIFRNLVFIKNGLGENMVKQNFLEEKYKEIEKTAENFSNQDLIKILDILQSVLEKLKFTSIPSLPLELAIVEICGEKTEKKLDVRSEKIDKEVRDLKLENQASNIQHPFSNDDMLKLQEKWTYICETIRSYNFSLEALLRSVNITGCTQTTLLIEVPYSFHQRILESSKNREILESIISDILGRNIKVSTTLGIRPQRHEDIANIEVAADDEIIRVAAEIFNSDSIN